jgi:zinc D-Ala-D-Ala carboxypeptidase
MLKKQDLLLTLAVVTLMGCVWASNNSEKQSENKGEQKHTTPKVSAAELEYMSMQNTIKDTVSVAYLMGKFNPAKHQDFVQIAAKYSDKKEAYLRKETYEAFLKMVKAAEKHDVQLKILSATRNFDRQKKIWEDKWTGLINVEDGTKVTKIADPTKRALKILLFSSMPGSSRHHWGTDLDLNYLSDDYFSNGQGKKIYKWLTENASTYGFCQPYSSKENGRTGYNEEKWHWSYMPLSSAFTIAAKEKMTDEMIVGGFKGSETAVSIGIVKNYVLGINTVCF